MIQSPDPNNSPQPQPRRRLWLMLLGRVGVPVAVVSAVAIGAGVWYASKFVNEDLAPLVQQNLSQLLDRPVELGRVERFSLAGIRFGRSAIPATPTDRDRASVAGVEVGFNLVELLLTRKLNLDVTLLQPDIYLDQDKNGVWVKTEIKSQEESGPTRTELKRIQFKDAKVELDAFPKPGQQRVPVTLRQVAGAANFFDNSRRIAYDIDGESTKQGGFTVNGETIVNNGLNSNLNVRGRDFLLVEIDRLVKFPVNLRQGRTDGNVNVQLRPNQPTLAKGTAQFRDATLEIPRVPQTFAKSNGSLRIDGTLITLEPTTTQFGKVPVRASGKIDTQKGFDLAAQVKAVTIANFFDTFQIKSPVAVTGEAAADIRVTGAPNSPIVSGQVRTTKVTSVDRLDLRQASADFRLNTSTLTLALANVQATPEVGGQVAASGQLNLNEPRSIAINYQAQSLPGDAIARLYNNGGTLPITVGRVDARGQIVGRLDNVQTIAQFQVPEASYPGSGEVVIANGNAILRNAVFQVAGGTVTAQATTRNGRWQGTVQASNVQASRFAPQVQGLVNGNVQLAGSLSAPRPENIQANGQVRLTNGNSFVNANINAIAGQFRADTQIAGIALNQFSSQLRGDLSGNVSLTGAINALRPDAIRANGQVRLSQGISLIDQPLTAQINWDGQKLNIPTATARGFSANGAILADLSGTPRISGLDLAIRTTDFALASLPIPRPPVTQLAGNVDLSGRLTGTPDRPSFVSNDVAVRGFSLNGIAFDRRLNGRLSLTPTRGFDVQVAGVNDRIVLDLEPGFRPRSLEVRRNQASVIGRTVGNVFQVAVNQFPIDGFILPGVNVARFGGISGTLAGNLNIDLDRLRVLDGSATVERFRLGSFRTDRATTRFVNNNNVFRFDNTALVNGQSRYELTDATVDLRSKPKFNGKIAIAQGRIEDVLGGLQIFEFRDLARGSQPPTYGRAADIQPVAVGDPQAPLLDQLRRFAEINALLQQNAQASRENRIPQVADVRGSFGGTINVAASLDGVQADFDLRGQKIEARPYRSTVEAADGKIEQTNDRVLTADQVIALGRLNNGVVTLEPLRIQSGDAQINLTGQFGGDAQFGQLEARNLPIAEIERFYPLPLEVDGKLNANVTVSGTRNNPNAVGRLEVVDGFLNSTPIQSATGNFTYVNSRLSFGSNIAIAKTDPIVIEGSIPYQLLPDSVRPDSSQISLRLDVKNDGLAILNVFTRQVAWRDGQGEVKLNVDGTLLRPLITGSINVANATIDAPALQAPLTGVTGSILFDRDRIRVESLQGQFSRGQVVAKGILPILVASAGDAENPLRVTLDRLAINRKGLYQGGVTGDVTVRGTAFAPEIGGQVELANGQILIPDTTAGGTANTTGSGTANRGQSASASTGREATTGSESTASTVTLNDLKLVLGDRVQIVRAPILNFVASGALTVNGGLDALQPEGTIRIRSGQVNLFTTQFVLERGYPQTAIFERNRGLDPVLNVRLIASVPEVTRSRIATPGTAEFTDDSLFATGLGSLRTVRVQARVEGPASQIFQNLELSSSPSRSRSELVALIGGGFVNTLGRGDSVLGIANLAGSAFLTNIQGFIGNAIGLSEFRLFPTLLRNENRRDSSLGLAAEAGVDITRNISASVLRVLTADQPTQFSVRYRINDSLLFRGSSDFSGDSQAVLEYETRF